MKSISAAARGRFFCVAMNDRMEDLNNIKKESAAAPKPHWWTDEGLLEASRQAVEAAPESAGAWQMRATVLGCFEE